jgi:8-oxo-dGTP pyrophosphatase MutT (NUDIX family)
VDADLEQKAPLRIRVGGLWIAQGSILLESLRDREVWGVPGGALEPGESLEEACRREFHEELGLQVRCGEMALIVENTFKSSGNLVREVGFYYEVSPIVTFDSIHPPLASQEPHLQFRWFPLEELLRIEFVPRSLPELITALTPGATTFRSVNESDAG